MRTLFISLATLLALAGCRQNPNGATADEMRGGTRTDRIVEPERRVPADIPDRIPTPKIGDPGNETAGGGAGPSGQTGTTGSTMGDDGLVRPGGGNTTAPGTTGAIGPDGGIGSGGPVMDRGTGGGAGGPSIDRGTGGGAGTQTPTPGSVGPGTGPDEPRPEVGT